MARGIGSVRSGASATNLPNLLACAELSMVDRNCVVAGLISILLVTGIWRELSTEPLRRLHADPEFKEAAGCNRLVEEATALR